MTEPHIDDVTLDAHVEGLLPEAERAAVDAHLAACTRCAGEVRRQRALLERLAALPRAIEPDDDLRPAIRAQVRRRAAGDERRRQLRALRVPLAAAALLLIAISAGVTALVLDSRDRAPELAGRQHGRDDVTLASFDASRTEHVRTASDLQAVLERHRDELSPETIELVERNLRTIEQALREADEALRADPSSPVLLEMILATEAKKVEVLRWANSLVRG
ncbi:MAG TPA: zf-HC2 domain-containing protein [Longimicrobiales bacterium]